MLKYLLFGGMKCYAAGGVGDFIKSFDTQEEAEDHAKSLIGDPYNFPDRIEWWQVALYENFEQVSHSEEYPY